MCSRASPRQSRPKLNVKCPDHVQGKHCQQREQMRVIKLQDQLQAIYQLFEEEMNHYELLPTQTVSDSRLREQHRACLSTLWNPPGQ